MGGKNASRKHFRRVCGPLWFWLLVKRQSTELLVNPHQEPPVLGADDLGAVGFRHPDDQERAYRFLESHGRAGVRGFRQHYEKAIAKHEVLVIDRNNPDFLLA
jgi:hypothetical protein